MSRMRILGLAGAVLFVCAQAQAKDASQPAVPPDNGEKLSQIIASIEQRDHFRFISDIEWDDDGYYEITYYTTDKAKVELRINPVSGKPEAMN